MYLTCLLQQKEIYFTFIPLLDSKCLLFKVQSHICDDFDVPTSQKHTEVSDCIFLTAGRLEGKCFFCFFLQEKGKVSRIVRHILTPRECCFPEEGFLSMFKLVKCHKYSEMTHMRHLRTDLFVRVLPASRLMWMSHTSLN